MIGRARGVRSKVYVDDGSLSTVASVTPVWERGSRRLFESLDPITERIVIMRETPWVPFNAPSCLSRQQDPTACDFGIEGAVHLDEELYAGELRASTTKVSFVDPTRWICPGDLCHTVDRAGRIIYRDEDHLTATFSRSLAPKLGRAPPFSEL